MISSILTVTAAASSQDLTTLAAVKAELELTTTDATRDALLSTMVTEASAFAASYCNRVFIRETLSEAFRLAGPAATDPDGPPPLRLARFPVSSVTSATESVSGTATALVAADYEIDGDPGLLWRLDSACDRRRSWWWCADKVTVVYLAGYANIAALPADLQRAAIGLVKEAYFGRKRDPMVKSVDVIDVAREQYWVGSAPGQASGIPEDIAALLNPYRQPAL